MKPLVDVDTLDQDKVLRIDLGSQETKRNMRKYCADWGNRSPFYVPHEGHVIVIVGRQADALEVYHDRERFSNIIPKDPAYRMFDKFMGVRILAQMDGEPHDRIRRLMTPALSPKAVARLEDGVTAAIDRLLDDIEAGGPRFDGMKDFGDHLIYEGMLWTMLGLGPDQKAVFKEMHRVIPLITYISAGETYPDECVRAFDAARKMIDQIVIERRQNPGVDLISALIAARDEGDKLSDEEMFDQIFTVTAGALSGTTQAAGSALYSLYSHPGTVQRLQADPNLIPQAFAECQRWHSGYLTFPRFPVADTEVGGTKILKGMVVRVCPQAAHYDPEVYDDPQRFDITRNARNIAFGSGPHLCLGNNFAKSLLRIAIQKLITRFPDARLEDPAMQVEYGGAVGQMRIMSLPMVIA